MSKTPSPGGLGAARIVRNGLGHTRGMGTGLLGDSGARNPPQLTCAEPGLLSTRQGEIDTVLSIAAYQRFIPTAQGGAGGRRRDDTRGTLTRCSHRGSRNL